MGKSYTFYGLPFGDYVVFMFHDLNGNKEFDMDPQTGKPTDGFYLFNGDKMGPGQQIMFDQIKFHVDQPEVKIEAIMNYPPFTSLGN